MHGNFNYNTKRDMMFNCDLEANRCDEEDTCLLKNNNGAGIDFNNSMETDDWRKVVRISKK